MRLHYPDCGSLCGTACMEGILNRTITTHDFVKAFLTFVHIDNVPFLHHYSRISNTSASANDYCKIQDVKGQSSLQYLEG